ncbi:putative phosphate transport protein (TIGR00153 family) [Pullulanibacillus pueri]|nr:putative phosphate transport protein (TIGR00153 family) [Pullulanibacillus pueri]
MLKTISTNLEEAAQYFVDFKIKTHEDLVEFSKAMKAYEKKGDVYIHELIVDLNKTFITPLEREDILALAMKLDDVLDGYEQWASRVEIYEFTSSDDYMIRFVDLLLEATKEIAEAAHHLSRRKLQNIRKHVIRINDLESECDDILQESIRELFKTEKDPIKIIQYKELYEMLELIADNCEDVANTLETIIMRNS